MHYNVGIIGGGAVGCAMARELSRYDISVVLLEKNSDVASGTSGRNSAVVHSGFNNKPGSLMAQLCVEGNLNFESVCKELDVPYKKTGKLIVAFNEYDMEIVDKLVENGTKNGTPGLEVLNEHQVRELEPCVGGIGGMLSKETAIINPFLYTIALAENAAENGVRFLFNFEVANIIKKDKKFIVQSKDSLISCDILINSAGLYSDKISEMAGVSGYKIYPCRGEYVILDKSASNYLSMPVYPVPNPKIGGLGVHLTPTTDGNIIIGPSAEYINAPSDYSTTDVVRKKLIAEAHQLLPAIAKIPVIGGYSGIRSKIVAQNSGVSFGDFIIKEESTVEGLINLIGIESPGLTSSIPIAHKVIKIIENKQPLNKKINFKHGRKGIIRLKELTIEQKEALILENPEYGEIICRCEQVSKAEIRAAIENSLGVKTLAGIKYRCRAMMGKCQGGYCLAKIADILVKEYGLNIDEIRYRENGSELFNGRVK